MINGFFDISRSVYSVLISLLASKNGVILKPGIGSFKVIENGAVR